MSSYTQGGERERVQSTHTKLFTYQLELELKVCVKHHQLSIVSKSEEAISLSTSKLLFCFVNSEFLLNKLKAKERRERATN